MSSVQELYRFKLPGGEKLYCYTLQNDRGARVVLSNYGAIICAYVIPLAGGGENDIVLGFDRLEDYFGEAYLADYPWMGAAVGRHANRIRNAEFSLDGHRYTLTANRPPHQLHGGHTGFDRVAWNCTGFGTDPHPWVELQYHSPDGEEGFPGNLDLRIRFELGKENELTYSYKASTDKPTVVNLTHHSYFNLGTDKTDIRDHEVKIYGSSTLDQDPALVATGTVSRVEGTPYDLRSFRSIREGLAAIPEYDKSYIVDKREDGLVAEARSPQTGLVLQVYSTDPILHFYSGKWMPTVKGKKGADYGPFSGLCLETHHYPNAIHIPAFPPTILRPGEMYSSQTTYKVLC